MSFDKNKLLVCGAFAGETDLLKIAGFNVLDTGVGNLASALSLQEYIFEHTEINSVVFAGSAGFYHDRFATGQIVCSGSFYSINPAATRGLIKIPEIMTTNIDTHAVPELTTVLSDVARGKTNSFSGITIYDPGMEDLEKLKDIDFENMETFGLASVCYRQNKNFTALYCLTNKVGSDGSAGWQSNWKKCSISLQNFLISALSEKTEP